MRWSQVGDPITPPGYFSNSGSFPTVCSQQDANLPGIFSWRDVANQCSWDLSIQRSDSTFRALGISQPRTLSRSFTTWTLRKNSSLPLVLEVMCLQSFPKIHDHTWRSQQSPIGKLTALRCLKIPALWTQSDEDHVELRLLYNFPYTSVFRDDSLPARSHATENRSRAYWRPCSENATSTIPRAKSKRLILHPPTVTFSLSRLLLSNRVIIDYEEEWQ